MDEQEKMSTQNDEAPASDLPKEAEGGVPDSVNEPQDVSNEKDKPEGAMGAGDILAPQKKLEETLGTLKEYQEVVPPKPVEPEVKPEEITAETKLTVEEDPNFKGDAPTTQAPPGAKGDTSPSAHATKTTAWISLSCAMTDRN